jgi:hypothetical protein
MDFVPEESAINVQSIEVGRSGGWCGAAHGSGRRAKRGQSSAE